MAVPFFFVSSGRSGTQMMAKMLGTFDTVDMHHEYLCTHVQPLAVKYRLGRVDFDDACLALERWHGAAVSYCSQQFWGDASNKLSWMIPPLKQLFPQAKFIHLVRDGRKVTSSYYHKLGNEIYDDRSTSILQQYVDRPESSPEPPPEKKYWWLVPSLGDENYEQFKSFIQFQRICYHWAQCHRCIIEDLLPVAPQRQMTLKLEDLISDPNTLRKLLAFIGLPYRDDLFDMLQRPHNVHTPRDRLLTDQQNRWLMDIGGDMMAHFGYDDKDEYRMHYDSLMTE